MPAPSTALLASVGVQGGNGDGVRVEVVGTLLGPEGAEHRLPGSGAS